MIPLDNIRCRLQPIELELNHREFAYDVIDWVDHCGKQYGCIDVAGREVLSESQQSRGDCSFHIMRHIRLGVRHEETTLASPPLTVEKQVHLSMRHACAAVLHITVSSSIQHTERNFFVSLA